MKYLSLYLLAFSFVAAPAIVQADDSIFVAATALQPKLTEESARTISAAVEEYSEAYHLDWKLLLAILFQESSLYRDPQGCLLKNLQCKDLGVGQVNWKTWAKTLNLTKVRLVTDYRYAISITARILAGYRDRFQAKDRYWLGRYNSGTPEYRREYHKRITAHRDKIRLALFKGQSYGRIRTSGQFRRIDHGSPYVGRQEVVYARADSAPLYPFFGPRREVLGTIKNQPSAGN